MAARRILGDYGNFDDQLPEFGDPQTSQPPPAAAGQYQPPSLPKVGAPPPTPPPAPEPTTPWQPWPGVTPPGGGITQPSYGASTDWSNPATVEAYFKSRGVTPNGTSPQYWADKFKEPWAQDKAYYWQRLQNADEFTGGPAAGGGGYQAPAPGNMIPVGDDPFSKLINTKLTELINNNGYLGPDTEAQQLENVRGVARRFQKAGTADISAQLANRGGFDQFNPTGGQFQDASQRMETNDIAPMFADAARSYSIDRANTANNNLMGALGQGTNRQGMLSDIALRNLAQSQDFSKFLATFGLERDKTLYELQHNNDSTLAMLLGLYLNGAKTSAGGHV